MLLTVVIPMYNERDVIGQTLRTLAGTLEEAASGTNGRGPFDRYEILVSDDGSDDGSAEIVRRVGRSLRLPHGSLRLLSSRVNHGKGRAVRDGMLAARGDLRLFTDSDLAYGADVLVSMTREALDTGVGVLIGSRAADAEGYAAYPPARRIASKLYRDAVAVAAGFRYTDSQCGCKLFTAEAAERIFSLARTDGWAFDLEALLLADRMGIAVGEYPVRVLTHRASKVRLLRDSAEMLGEIVRIRRYVNSLPQSP